MSRSELHNWECTIERICGDKANEMFEIAQDIYNTAYVRGKNAKEWEILEQEPKADIDKIRAEIEQAHCKPENSYDLGRNYGLYMALEIIDEYRQEFTDENTVLF